jgi:hypothetical protein
MQRRSSCRAGASLFQPKHRAPLDRYRASCEGSRRSIGYAGPPNRPLRVGSTLAGADLVPGGTSLLGRRRPRRVGSTSAGVALVPGVASLLRGRNSTISTGWGPRARARPCARRSTAHLPPPLLDAAPGRRGGRRLDAGSSRRRRPSRRGGGCRCDERVRSRLEASSRVRGSWRRARRWSKRARGAAGSWGRRSRGRCGCRGEGEGGAGEKQRGAPGRRGGARPSGGDARGMDAPWRCCGCLLFFISMSNFFYLGDAPGTYT